MFSSVAQRIFGSKNSRELKQLNKVVAQINEFEATLSALGDSDLSAKTSEFRDRLDSGESLQQLLPEAFAVVREASRRTLGMRHFDVQLVGGMVLHHGKIAEMRTGEGKTLVATLPCYLNALGGKGVHVITVNDYLAARDASWMAPVYEFLGLSVGVVVSGQSPEEKKAAYQADITYGTNNEFGFDYLRDNMAFSIDDRVQRGHHFSIVDEVDSILIDEARTPLIISGPVADSSERYVQINKLVPGLTRAYPEEEGVPAKEGDFLIDEKHRSIELTETGHSAIEGLLVSAGMLEEGESLYAASNLNLLHHVYAALRAHHLFRRDVEYVIQNQQVVIVDEHTGRTMPGRRWGEGLHQAIEAKEKLSIQNETQTLASTTFQNYFRIYDKLAGMTGTADTEAYEFNQIYGLDVVVIPTNLAVARIDYNDLVFLTLEEKWQAIIEELQDVVAQGRPVLVGTASIESSEHLSRLMKKARLPHNVLNAKQHEREADIIAQAGIAGTVTIATNMAGRGTDIVLGGNWEAEIAGREQEIDGSERERLRQAWQVRHDAVIAAGGLHIIGTERHESRRIDNQLRGRAGRQGDPGSTRFYISLEDNLMRIFASDRVKSIMQALGMEKGEAIEHRMVSNAIEKAQRKVEGRNFDIRKQLLEYDDVANDQRSVIYQQRDALMTSDDISDMIDSVREDVVNGAIAESIPPQSVEEQWDIEGLEKHLETDFAIKLPVQQWLDEDEGLHEDNLKEKILDSIVDSYRQKEELVGPATIRSLEKQVFLQVLDTHWKEHLASMDHLRQGIHLRGYANKNPRQEYKREAFELFQMMLGGIKQDVVRILSHLRVQQREEVEAVEQQRREALARQLGQSRLEHEQKSSLAESTAPAESPAPAAQPAKAVAEDKPYVREQRKIGRNEPCPCGSGRKYKHCHGKLS